jgi:hypothetical protein
MLILVFLTYQNVTSIQIFSKIDIIFIIDITCKYQFTFIMHFDFSKKGYAYESLKEFWKQKYNI